MKNPGQTCIAPDYLLIVGNEQRQKKATEALLAEIRKQFPGDVATYPEYARIVNEKHFARVDDLLKSSGKVLYGGKTNAAQRFIEPTVLVDCKPDSPVMNDEIFGPLLPIVYCSSADEAIEYIQARPKPLTLYIFSDSSRNVEYVLSRTHSGTACVNEAVFQYLNPHLPFGGVGPSGVGAIHGHASFLEFSNNKSVLIRSTFGDLYFRYLPHLQKKWVQNLFDFLMEL
jgi:aldehyde dehydrogenase (NAD+)